jgi:hypothetical protein
MLQWKKKSQKKIKKIRSSKNWGKIKIEIELNEK